MIMNNSITITINGVLVLDVQDADAEQVSSILRHTGRLIRRFGMRGVLAELERDPELQGVCMAKAQGGSPHLSTIVG